jgi:hypothetical protein
MIGPSSSVSADTLYNLWSTWQTDSK